MNGILASGGYSQQETQHVLSKMMRLSGIQNETTNLLFLMASDQMIHDGGTIQ